MKKNTKSNSDFLYPFCQHKSYAEAKVGAYNWQQRWAAVNKHLHKKDTYESVQLYPTVAILNYVKQHKKLPHPLYHHCIVIDSPIAWLTHIDAIMAFDIAAKNNKPKSLLPNTITKQGTHPIYIEKNVIAEQCYMNTQEGAIFIGKNVHLQAGTYLRGPLYIGDNTMIKMGATIYGHTIIGSNCLVGGEVKQSILMDNSNKAHYGYLGNSVIGEWCNLGAGTTNSNVKNNASTIVIQQKSKAINAGQKFGILLGDYSKTAINTALNTGTVVGISANIFCNGLTPKSIANFSWGVEGKRYIFEKAIEDIDKWMEFKPLNTPNKQKLKKEQIKKLKIIYNEAI